MDFARHRFAVTHFFDETQELRDDRSDTAASSDKDNVIECFDASLHTPVGTVYKGTVCMPRAMCQCALNHFLCKSAKGPKDKDHVPVSFAILRWKIIIAQRRDGKWVVFEY